MSYKAQPVLVPPGVREKLSSLALSLDVFEDLWLSGVMVQVDNEQLIMDLEKSRDGRLLCFSFRAPRALLKLERKQER